MTKKDYEILAKIISCAPKLRRDDRASIDNILLNDNPRYDKEKFWEAVRKYQ